MRIEIQVGLQALAKLCAIAQAICIVACDSTKKESDAGAGSSESRRGTQRTRSLNTLDSGRLSKTLFRKNYSSDIYLNRDIEAFSKKLKSLSASDLQRLLDEAKDEYDKHDGRVWHCLIEELARKDPSAAVDRLLAFPEDKYQAYQHIGVFEILSSSAPEALFEKLSHLDEVMKHQIEKRAVFFAVQVLAEKNPELAVQLAEKMGTYGAKHISEICNTLGKSDKLRAINLIDKCLTGASQNSAKAGLAVALGKDEPSAGLDLLANLPHSEDWVKNAYQEIILQSLASDFDKAIGLLNAMSQGDLHAALAGERVIAQISKQNSESAMRVIERLVFTSSNTKIYQNAVHSLAKKAPKKTVEWILDFPESKNKLTLLGTAYYQWSKNSLNNAVKGLAELQGEERKVALEGVAISWGVKDMKEAVEWGGGITDKEERSLFIYKVLQMRVSDDPIKIAEVVGHGEAGSHLTAEKRASLLQRTAEGYFDRNKKDAMKWVMGLDETGKISAARGMVNAWAKKDVNELGKWVEGLAEGDLRDVGVRAMVSQLRDSHPDAAKAWEQTLSKSYKKP